jgi:hypothetical protein
MDIQIRDLKAVTYPNLGRYVYADLASGKHAVFVAIEDGGGALRNAPAVQVIVQNASHRVWRGMGKRFPTIEAAVANYRTPEIRALIRAAAELAPTAVAA